MNAIFKEAKAAVTDVATIDDRKRREVLLRLADAIEAQSDRLLKANAEDLVKMPEDNPLHDRLQLTEARISGIASDMRVTSALPSPLGRILLDRTLPNGLHLRKVSVPFGVIGVIYEARPNVTFDVFSLCFKSGNVCVLKGGRDADASNREAVRLIREVLGSCGVNPCAVNLLPPTHEATAEMLSAVGHIDLVIPRGGRKLIDFVRDNAKVPCIETGAGVVNTYFDAEGDLETGRAVITNAKTRRVSVCNALDCLLVHRSRLRDLPALCDGLKEKNVTIYADDEAFHALEGAYPLLEHATDESWGLEYMDWKMSLRTVGNMDEAIAHIDRHGSGHSECIITENALAASSFQNLVDAACVYVNAPTSFTDGAQFGLGAEIGISTQKLGARGPMGLEEMTSYKWLINGHGQTRG